MTLSGSRFERKLWLLNAAMVALLVFFCIAMSLGVWVALGIYALFIFWSLLSMHGTL